MFVQINNEFLQQAQMIIGQILMPQRFFIMLQ